MVLPSVTWTHLPGAPPMERFWLWVRVRAGLRSVTGFLRMIWPGPLSKLDLINWANVFLSLSNLGRNRLLRQLSCCLRPNSWSNWSIYFFKGYFFLSFKSEVITMFCSFFFWKMFIIVTVNYNIKCVVDNELIIKSFFSQILCNFPLLKISSVFVPFNACLDNK